MITIDEIKLDGSIKDKDKEIIEIEKFINTQWEALQNRHRLPAGNGIRLRLYDKFKHEVTRSMINGNNTKKVRVWPAGVGIATTQEIYINGTPRIVRYYKSVSIRNEGQVKVPYFKPDTEVMTHDTTLSTNDRDYIMFLYVFSNVVKTKPSQILFTIDEKKAKNKLYFEDREAMAEERIENRNRAAEASLQLRSFDEIMTRRFAGMINIPGASIEPLVILKDSIYTNIEKGVYAKGMSTFELLQDFIENSSDDLFKIKEAVATAARKKILKSQLAMDGKQAMMTWSYQKGGVKGDEIYRFNGKSTAKENLVNFFASDEEAYKVLLEKLEETVK